MERIKYYMGLLIIALLCCNTMNSQVKYEIKTKKCLNEIHSENPIVARFVILSKIRRNRI